MNHDEPSKGSPRRPDDAPDNPSRRRFLNDVAITGAALAVAGSAIADGVGADTFTKAGHRSPTDKALHARVQNVVLIYLENRSFNNLFADFPGLESPLSKLPKERALQRDRDGSVLKTLPPIWQGLAPYKQWMDGKTWYIGEDAFRNLPNAPWILRTPSEQLLPHGLVTRDLIHVFYRNQWQINHGKMDGFVAWGDSGALAMARYANSMEDFYLWRLAHEYTLLDNFFMGAFGDSFLAHQYLVAAQPPRYPDAAHSPAKHRIAVLEGDDPKGTRLKLAPNSPASAMDGNPRPASRPDITPDGFAVNTFYPAYSPSVNFNQYKPELADWSQPEILPPQDHLTIGDTLSAAGVDWAWYSGGWDMALEGKGFNGISNVFPQSPMFQANHQPLNYFKQFAPGTQARARHLRDGGVGNTAETNKFIADIVAGCLPQVAFYKPQGNFNMHAGYSDLALAASHVEHVIEALKRGPQWEHTVVIITHDENGGWWDHVAPPKGDRWGPSVRIPAMVVSPLARKGHVDHTIYDTGSIQRFLNRRFDLRPLPGIVMRDDAMQKANGIKPGDLTAALELA